MRIYTLNETDKAALAVLRSTGADVQEAALVAKSALEAEVRASEATALRALKRCKKIIALGAEALRQQERTVTFEKAVAFALEARKDRREQAIYILPQHSKTGGARRVTIHKPLLRILRRHTGNPTQEICPANWLHHWRELRCAARWDSPAHRWQQDALRHTFASYHLSYFRIFAELQLEIGHRDATLLRTRYVGPVRPTGGFRCGVSRGFVHAQRGIRPCPPGQGFRFTCFTGNDMRKASGNTEGS